ncbi:MAG: LPP20 family lipoprotein [Acidobacteriota bacterium]|nr:LPP20 family lipoprotein [Acidobacteriota bacterium]
MKSAAKLSCLFLLVWLAAAGYATPQSQEYSPAQAKLMAREAAINDGYRTLSEIIFGLTIQSQTSVQNYVVEHDEIRTKLDPFIKGAKIIATRYNSDGSCDVDIELQIEDLEKLLGKKVDYDIPVIAVTGSGAPPRGNNAPAAAIPNSAVKKQFDRVIRVNGSGALPSKDETINAAQARLMAIGAAKQDAYRALSREIYGINVEANTYVRDFVMKSDKIKSNVDAFVRGARVVDTKFDGQIATVTLELRLNALAEIIY